MQDVIFNGTETRKKHTFCEVSLVFDNTKRIFAVDADEVTMTRRLYSAGESKYLVNGEVKRLPRYRERVKIFWVTIWLPALLSGTWVE